MKRLVGCIVIIIIAMNSSMGQDLPFANFSGGNVDGDAQGGNPGLSFVFQQWRNEQLSNKEDKLEYEGSPYWTENFQKTAVYSADGLEGNVFTRYDGYNEEVQLRTSLNAPKTLMLVKTKDFYCEVNGERIVYMNYYTKKGEYKEGHLFELLNTPELSIFERRLKRFKEGKEAGSSFELAVPNKFITATEYFYSANGEVDAQFLKPAKKNILALFNGDSEKQKKVKTFISKNNIRFKNSEDFKKVFAYYNTLE